MPDHRKPENKVQEDFLKINVKLIKAGYTINTLRKASTEKSCASPNTLQYVFFIIAILIPALYMLHNNGMFDPTIKYLLGVRCIVPNNYFVWEATRPLSDCNFCVNVSKVQILPNLTREHFSQFAYSSKPMVIKGAFSNWPAIKVFSFDFFKKLYETFEDSYRSVDEECQFLHFQSDFVSLRDVFAMDYRRIKNLPGQKPWYVGWGNCHPQLLAQMRRYYPKPHFLPEDCEIPSKEYVFMGYEAGATMHLDFINRLMWQAQLKGNKTWYLKPPPECDNVCRPISFIVEPGDAVDTRVWYHGTAVAPGQFSLSIQSEYG